MSIATQSMGRDIRNSVPQHFLAANINEDGMVVDRERMYSELVTNDLLREDEAREIEEALTQVADRDRVGVEDLRANGLVAPLRNIGVTSYEFERMSAVKDAHQSMSIKDLGHRDRVAFTLDQVPIPVTSSQFELDRRNIAAGQTRGMGVDTTNVEEHTRAVVRKLEDTLTNGGDVTLGGNGLPGYTDFANRQTVSFEDVEWSSTTDLKNAITDALKMRDALRANGYDGPYILYIPSNWDQVIDDDYKAESEATVRERILRIQGIQEVKVLPALSDSNSVMVQMTRSVVQMPVGQEITTVTWDLMGGLASRWAIMAVAGFALKTAEDETGTAVSGIAHLS